MFPHVDTTDTPEVKTAVDQDYQITTAKWDYKTTFCATYCICTEGDHEQHTSITLPNNNKHIADISQNFVVVAKKKKEVVGKQDYSEGKHILNSTNYSYPKACLHIQILSQAPVPHSTSIHGAAIIHSKQGLLSDGPRAVKLPTSGGSPDPFSASF